MADLIDTPTYFGSSEMLEVVHGPKVDKYFETTKIKEWSLRDFLVSNNNADDFLNSIERLWKKKSVDAKEAALNALRSAQLAESERALAQTNMANILKDKQIKAEASPSGILGKRPRLRTAEKKDRNLPLSTLNENDEIGGEQGDRDPVTMAEEKTHLPLNVVFEVDEQFEFDGALCGIDMSDQFSQYYTDALAQNYDADNVPDFLATAGILFLEEDPTILQEKYFGNTYSALLEKMNQLLQHPTKEEEKEAREFCRSCRDAFRDEKNNKDRGAARKALRCRVMKEEESTLKEMFIYGSKLHKECKPITETDQISGFVLKMLSPIMDRADETRLAFTATTPTTGSLLIRLFHDMPTLPRHPDIIVKHQEQRDVGFGEVSLSANFAKDRGDLCRCALWSKRALDQLVATYRNVDHITVLFLQVINRSCTFYQMRRCGTICIASRLCEFDIVFCLDDLLTKFEDHVQDWILVTNVFESMLDLLREAKPRKDTPLPRCFVGIATPRARNMQQGCDRSPSRHSQKRKK